MTASATPAYSDILVVVVLGLILFATCGILLQVSRKWTSILKKRIAVAKERRRLHHDKFREENGFSWDYVIAFKVYEEDELVTEQQQKFNMKYILAHIALGGIESRLSYSVQHTIVFCKLRAPITRLLIEADRIDYTLPTNPVELENVCSQGRKDFWGPLNIPKKDETGQTALGAYEYVYMKHNYIAPEARVLISEQGEEGQAFLEWHDTVEKVYKRWPSSTSRMESGTDLSISTVNPINSVPGQLPYVSESILRGVDRLKLIRSILTSRGTGGCHLDIDVLLNHKCVIAVFPLHDLLELNELELSWLKLFELPWHQDIEKVKNYFGEKIGLYFAWLGLYTSWLFPAAVVGALFWINIALDGNDPNAVSIPYFAGFMSLWATLFLEYWKRAEKGYALKWGMLGFEDSEVERPAFIGEPSISPIDGKPSLYFAEKERNKRMWKSNATITCLLFVVLATIALIFFIRAVISSTPGLQGAAGIISSLLLAIQIQIMNEIYGGVAIKLNDYENHRTDTEYEDALITKTFMFQFVNSYASLFYICFVKPFIQTIDPCLKSCMSELQVSLGTIFLTRLMLGNFIELGMPFLQYLFKRKGIERILANARPKDATVSHPSNRKQPETRVVNRIASSTERRSSAGINLVGVYNSTTGGSVIVPDVESDNAHRYDISEIETAFMLAEYDVMMGTFEDYAEMIIQFGYTTMFITGFPLATLMSLVNNYVEIRIDGWKLCQLSRRPEPRSQEDIGTWQIVLDGITTLGIFINAAIVAFTGSYAIDDTWSVRIWIFLLLSSGLLCVKLLLQYVVPDIPIDIGIQIVRQELIVDKVINNIEDDDDSELLRGVRGIPSLIVQNVDDDPL